MEYPFINDLSKKTLSELQNDISELTKKLNFAYRIGHSSIIHQLTVAINSYKEESTKRMDELMKKSKIDTKVNIQKED
jgi:hypothetical protein